LKAEFLNGSLNTSGADGPTRLSEFLGDDLGREGVVEKKTANDLSDDLGGPLMGFARAALLAMKGKSALLLESVKQLKEALFRVPELRRCSRGPQTLALAFIKHSKFQDDLVVVGNGNGPMGALKEDAVFLSLKHFSDLLALQMLIEGG